MRRSGRLWEGGASCGDCFEVGQLLCFEGQLPVTGGKGPHGRTTANCQSSFKGHISVKVHSTPTLDSVLGDGYIAGPTIFTFNSLAKGKE